MPAVATMADVAKAVGVSKMTVSRALAGGKVSSTTRARIREAVDALGYVPDLAAGALSSRRSGFVAMLVPTLANSNFADTVRGLSDGLAAAGLQVLLGYTDYSLEREARYGPVSRAMGLLLSAFPLTYALAQLPLGPIIDRLGSGLLLGAGLVVWSLAQCLAGFAGSAAQLWLLRFLLGVGEAPTLPCSTKVVRRWYSPRTRGTPVGIFTGANHLGQALAAPVLTLAMVGLGWRWMFVAMGLVGFCSAAVWFATYRDPADAGLDPADHAHLAEGETQRDVRGCRTSRTRPGTGPNWCGMRKAAATLRRSHRLPFRC